MFAQNPANSPPTALAATMATAADLGLRSGPMVGYAELTEASLWVQTIRPAQVQFRYWIDGEANTSALSPLINTTWEGDCIARAILSRLKSGKRYGYELYLDGKLVQRPYRLSFQTQPQWQWRTDPPAFTVALGSCAFINETEYDRPGAPYGGEYEIFTAIAAKQPDVMLWLGDNVYYREPDFYSVAFMRHRNAHARAVLEMQALLGSTHNYAIWDDHDYGPNNSDRTYSKKRDALQIFKEYWLNPAAGIEEAPGVFFSFTWADVDFFMLDDRYHRSPDRYPDLPDKVMFGKEQMRWLKEALVSSRAPFKIIAGGNQMLNPQIGDESFSAYKNEYAELLNWIKSNEVWGVLFLSGDVHRTELIRVEDPGFYPLYDYTNSPLTSGTHSPDRIQANPAVVPGTQVAGKRNFGMLRFDGPRTDRKLVMECYDNQGKLLWKHEVKATDLRPAKK
ncbi:MAG: alkaline phosphatase D family protein [bacterium]